MPAAPPAPFADDEDDLSYVACRGRVLEAFLSLLKGAQPRPCEDPSCQRDKIMVEPRLGDVVTSYGLVPAIVWEHGDGFDGGPHWRRVEMGLGRGGRGVK